jgi:hypothetical protein
MDLSVGRLVGGLTEFLKMIACDLSAEGSVDAPEDECSSDNLLRKDFLSHP